jgi:hypothetical protein
MDARFRGHDGVGAVIPAQAGIQNRLRDLTTSL